MIDKCMDKLHVTLINGGKLANPAPAPAPAGFTFTNPANPALAGFIKYKSGTAL